MCDLVLCRRIRKLYQKILSDYKIIFFVCNTIYVIILDIFNELYFKIILFHLFLNQHLFLFRIGSHPYQLVMRDEREKNAEWGQRDSDDSR